MIFDSIIQRFRAVDRSVRLDTLLDYASKLPEPPADLQAAADRERHRVAECQTPVFLWIGVEQGRVTIHAAVPRESPTVRGYLALLHSRMTGKSPAEIAEVPADLLERLGLGEALGMLRTQGLTAILGRIKRAVAEAAG